MKPLAPVLLFIATSPVAQLPDLVFERGNPSAFQTLQAALDAAQSGQRVIMRSAATGPRELGIIRRSITLEGQYAGTEFPITLEGECLRVLTLTPGMPLVLRNLDFFYSANSGYSTPAITTASLPADTILLDSVRMSWQSATWNTWMVSAHCRSLEVRNCALLGADLRDQPACCSSFRSADGVHGIFFSGTRLFLEDCVVRGGNANILYWVEPWHCFGSLCPEGGVGGTAIHAPNAFCVAVRTRISDGNGGSVGAGLWTRPPTPGMPAPSRFGTIVAYDMWWEPGRPDAGGAGTPRGTPFRIGFPDSPLSTGPARIGHPVTLTVGSSNLAPVAIALATQVVFTETLFGAAHVPLTPPPPMLSFPSVGSRNVSVPTLPELIDQPLVAQIIALHNGTPFLSNPSVSRIGR